MFGDWRFKLSFKVYDIAENSPQIGRQKVSEGLIFKNKICYTQKTNCNHPSQSREIFPLQ